MFPKLFGFVLAFMVILVLMVGCDSGGGTQSSRGGDVTGPTVTVNCQVTAAGGGSSGDVIVNTECPHESNNPVTTPGEGSEQ